MLAAAAENTDAFKADLIPGPTLIPNANRSRRVVALWPRDPTTVGFLLRPVCIGGQRGARTGDAFA